MSIVFKLYFSTDYLLQVVKYISSYKDVFVFSRNYKDNEALIIVNLGKKTRKNKVDVTGFYKVLATLENKNEGILLPYEGRVYFKKKI